MFHLVLAHADRHFIVVGEGPQDAAQALGAVADLAELNATVAAISVMAVATLAVGLHLAEFAHLETTRGHAVVRVDEARVVPIAAAAPARLAQVVVGLAVGPSARRRAELIGPGLQTKGAFAVLVQIARRIGGQRPIPRQGSVFVERFAHVAPGHEHARHVIGAHRKIRAAPPAAPGRPLVAPGQAKPPLALRIHVAGEIRGLSINAVIAGAEALALARHAKSAAFDALTRRAGCAIRSRIEHAGFGLVIASPVLEAGVL